LIAQTDVEGTQMGNNHDPDLERPKVAIYDSNFFEASERLDRYKEASARTYVPTYVEFDSEYEFRARSEVVNLEGAGLVSRASHVPLIAYTKRCEIEHAPRRLISASIIVSGECALELGKSSLAVRPTDLIIVDSVKPVVRKDAPGVHEVFSFLIPENELSLLDPIFCEKLPWQGKPIGPLSSLFDFVASNMFDCSKAELKALIEAASRLLLAATGSAGRTKVKEFDAANPIIQKIRSFVNFNLSDSALSAHRAAMEVGVSDRYVHRLFAARGTTFRAYVTARRLDHIRSHLTLHPRQSISGIAYRWGFNDVSTFNKAFKRRFGCTPGRFRTEAE
jgi:AraC-like DNA-binding protein